MQKDKSSGLTSRFEAAEASPVLLFDCTQRARTVGVRNTRNLMGYELQL